MVFDGPVETSIPAEIASHLVAVVREAVSNASRHAAAKRVEVSLAVTSEIVLCISDDGIGIAEDQSRRSGLANLRARAVQLGGSLVVTSPRNEGTTVTLRVPLDTLQDPTDG